MKSFCLVVLLAFFLVTRLMGQLQSFVYKIPDKFVNIEGGTSGDHIFLKGETANKTCFYVFHLLTQSFQLYIENKAVPDSKNDVTILGHAADERELHIYFRRGSIFAENLYCLTYSFDKNKFKSPVKIEEGSTKNDVAYLPLATGFNILSINKANQSLFLQKYSRDTLSNQIEFNIGDKKILKLFKDNFEYIPDHSNVSYEQSSASRKIYQYGEKIVAIVDDYKPDTLSAQVAVITFDTNEKKVASQFIDLPFDRGTQHNSFLFGGRLYVFGMDDAKFNLTVFDIATLQPLQDFKYEKGETILFKKSDLLESKTAQHDVSLDDKWEGKWDQTSINKYTFKMLKGDPVINVSAADENTIRLLIGNRSVQPGGGVGMYSPGIPIMTVGGTYYTPSFYSFSQMQGGEETRVFFYGYLDNTLKISGKKFPNHGPIRLADKRIQSLRKANKSGNFAIMSSASDVYLVYIDRKNLTLTIEEFQ